MTISILLNLSELKTISKSEEFMRVLLSIKDKLELIIEQRREEETASIKKMAEKQRKIKIYREHLAQDGISPNELLPIKPLLKKRQIVKSKKEVYVYQDRGKRKFWSGKGRMPSEIKKSISLGVTLESFIYIGDDFER